MTNVYMTALNIHTYHPELIETFTIKYVITILTDNNKKFDKCLYRYTTAPPLKKSRNNVFGSYHAYVRSLEIVFAKIIPGRPQRKPKKIAKIIFIAAPAVTTYLVF